MHVSCPVVIVPVCQAEFWLTSSEVGEEVVDQSWQTWAQPKMVGHLLWSPLRMAEIGFAAGGADVTILCVLCVQRALPVRHAAARSLLVLMRNLHKLEQREHLTHTLIQGQDLMTTTCTFSPQICVAYVTFLVLHTLSNTWSFSAFGPQCSAGCSVSGIYLEPGSDKQTCDWESGIDEFYAAKKGGGGIPEQMLLAV